MNISTWKTTWGTWVGMYCTYSTYFVLGMSQLNKCIFLSPRKASGYEPRDIQGPRHEPRRIQETATAPAATPQQGFTRIQCGTSPAAAAQAAHVPSKQPCMCLDCVLQDIHRRLADTDVREVLCDYPFALLLDNRSHNVLNLTTERCFRDGSDVHIAL